MVNCTLADEGGTDKVRRRLCYVRHRELARYHSSEWKTVRVIQSAYVLEL